MTGPLLTQPVHETLRAASDGRIVTVTTTVTFASLWLVPLLADFQRQHPEIGVRIAADNTVRDLERDRLDVAIRYSTRELAGAGALRLFGEHTLPVCSPKLLGKNKLQRAEELSNFVLLHFDDPGNHNPWLTWEVWFEAMKIKPRPPRGVLRFSHYDMMVRAAVNGQGTALGRLPLLASLLENGTLVAPLAASRFSAGARDRAYWLNATAAARERPEVCTFMDWLVGKAAAMQPKTTNGE